MAFLIYFFVLLVSAASVLFGLDLMSSPLPKTPNVPIGRSVQVASQPPIQEPHKKAADEQALTPVYPTTPGAPKVQAETSGAAPQQDAKLPPAPAEPTRTAAPAVTPPAPATPVPAATVAQNPAPAAAAAPPPAAPVAAAPPPSAPAAPTQPAATIAQNSQPAVVTPPQEPAREQQAKVEPAPQPQTKVEPAPAVQSVQTEAKQPVQSEAKVEPVTTTQPAKRAPSNSCNVQACSAAYQSFRASDCTYQPHGSERRLCSITGGAVTARAAKPDRPEKRSEQTARRSSAPDDEAERVVVKRQPLDLHPGSSRSATSSRGEMREVERIVRHMTRDEASDVPVQDAYGRVFIVPRGYR